MKSSDFLYVPNESGLRDLLRTYTGPTGAHVERLAKRFAARAKIKANEGSEGVPGGAGRPRRRTGDLVELLDAYGPIAGPDGPYWHVGSSAQHDGVAYPRALELGGFARRGRRGRRQGMSEMVFYRYPYLVPALPPDFVQGA